MAQMNLDGLTGTDQFTLIAEKAGALSDAMGDASAAIKQYSNDTFKLQAGIEAFQGIAAAATVATGVMGLLGTENEKVEQAILKVQSALAIMNGVQQIANTLNKDSALMLRLKSIWTAANTTATGANTVATGANTAATIANIINVICHQASYTAVPAAAPSAPATAALLPAVLKEYGKAVEKKL